MRDKHFKIILSIISILIFAYHMFNLFYLWSDSPSQIAIHFTGKTPDHWGSKYFLIVIPFLSILVCAIPWWCASLYNDCALIPACRANLFQATGVQLSNRNCAWKHV